MPLAGLFAYIHRITVYINITTASSKLLFIFVKFDSFLAGLGGNQVCGACYSVPMAHKPIQLIRQQALRSKVMLRLFLYIDVCIVLLTN